MDIEELIWLLNETSCGGIQLDGHIHALCNDIYDYKVERAYLSGKKDFPFHHGIGRGVPPYTSSVDFALRLLAQQLPGFSYSLRSGSKAEVFDDKGSFEGVHEHLPLALCIAILTARLSLGSLRDTAEMSKFEVGLFS